MAYRHQVSLKRVCPVHGNECYLVVLENTEGDLDIWVGCCMCPGAWRVEQAGGREQSGESQCGEGN